MEGTMERVVKEIFDRQNLYESLIKFYERLHYEYRYVVIVPRKCLTEYKIFRKLWKNDRVDDKSATFITTKGLVRYRDKFLQELESCTSDDKRKFLAVVDDMMIYGRGINEFLTDFFDGLGNDNANLIAHTYLEVFIESCNEKLFQNDFQDILKKRYNVFYTYGKKGNLNAASDIFIDSFFATCTPNTSFVRSWFFREDGVGPQDCLKDMEYNENLWRHDFGKAGESREYGGSYSRAWVNIVFSEKTKSAGMENLAEFCCMRYYYSKTLNRYAFTPYVFLKEMTFKEIDSILQQFKEVLKPFSVDGNDEIWKQQGNCKEFYILKYEYLTQIFSDLYGIYFFDKYMKDKKTWEHIFCDDSEVLSYSYGKGNVYSMPVLRDRIDSVGFEKYMKFLEDCRSIVQNSAKEMTQEDEYEREALDLLTEILEAADELSEEQFLDKLIRTYFARNGEKDNEKAEKAVRIEKIEAGKRIYGISTATLCKKILKSKKLSQQSALSCIYSSFLDCMDRGICSLTMKMKGARVASFLNAGEQAYRVFLDPYMHIFKYLAKIEDTCINFTNGQGIEFRIKEFLEKVLEDEPHAEKKWKDIRHLQSIMYAQGRSYRDMYVPRDDLDTELGKKYEKIYYEVML